MSWVELFAAFVVSHLAGDFLLQTDPQALNKFGGLGGGGRAGALIGHVVTYTLAFVPALIALGRSAPQSLGIAMLIAVPHLIQDDGRLLQRYMLLVKGSRSDPGEPLFVMVDQSFHLIILFAVALLGAT